MKPDIEARIRLLESANGGRSGPTRSDWWGCVFVVDGLNFDGRILLEKIGPLRPGEETIVPIAFLSPDLAKPRLREGTQFHLRESRIVGTGEVLRVF